VLTRLAAARLLAIALATILLLRVVFDGGFTVKRTGVTLAGAYLGSAIAVLQAVVGWPVGTAVLDCENVRAFGTVAVAISSLGAGILNAKPAKALTAATGRPSCTPELGLPRFSLLAGASIRFHARNAKTTTPSGRGATDRSRNYADSERDTEQSDRRRHSGG
jgi:hypothetical protein